MNKEKKAEVKVEAKKAPNIHDQEYLTKILYSIHTKILENKPHIIEYTKMRKLHGVILSDMMEYFYDGKFKFSVNTTGLSKKINEGDLRIIDCHFDDTTGLGRHGLANIIIYKNNSNINCLTEVFIKNNTYKDPEKKAFLNSMLKSSAGLFEITKTDMDEGYVYIKDVLSETEFCIIDMGLSVALKYDNIYIYMRIITYKDISFGTGLNLVFRKSDPFIRDWIKQNKENYNPKEESMRFLELYNEYVDNSKGINITTHDI
ncbi:MAG: hypothetical protein FWC47_13495 [Oscillospiraceae bacterium]|nr:hypothetical protein [Oscillospiraceae bacterium]